MFAPETVEKVLCHLLRFGASRADAEDLAQEALLVAWRERASLDTTRSLDGWLYGIARNVFRNHARRERRNPIDAVEDPDDAAPTGSIGDVLTLRTALHALPENQQDIVILHELEGHTLKETAELLAIPFDTAKDRLKRARVTLESACGATLDAAARAEPRVTQRVAKVAVASVLAGVLGAIAKESTAAAAVGAGGAAMSKLVFAAALVGGIAIGVVVDRFVRADPPPATSRESVATVRADAAVVDTAVVVPDAPPEIDATSPDARIAPTDDLAAEAALIDRARVAIRSLSPRDALRILDEHERRFRRGQLAEERELLAIEALVALHDARARARIERFRAAYPSSSHLARIEELAARAD